MDNFKYLYASRQIKLAEQSIAKDHGFLLFDLMVKAGKAVFDLACFHYPDSHHWLIVCGKGNNGGDGYIVATLAIEAGIKVTLLEVEGAAESRGDASLARQGFLSVGGAPKRLDVDELLSRGTDLEYDLVIDALLGTGLQGNLRPSTLDIIEAVNGLKLPTICVDVPSGLNSDTGQPMSSAMTADHTVCFIGMKQGLVTGRARDYVGQLHLANLSISEELLKQYQMPVARVDLCAMTAQILAPRKPTAHKGTSGRLAVVGGAQGMLGAARLASLAGLRVGSGLVRAYVEKKSLVAMQSAEPEVMAMPWKNLKHQDWSANALVIGPGLGQSKQAHEVFHSIIDSSIDNLKKTSAYRLVIDADGLNILAQSPMRNDKWVLTPHPGEAARLLGVTVAEIEEDRFAAVKSIQVQYGGVVVLKGAGTIIFDGSDYFLCTRGNAGMATGGMGDVLAGMIGSYLAQGYSTVQATMIGVLIHSMSADNCVKEQGQLGLIASDLLPEIRRLTNYFANSCMTSS
ncbi:NAD(P)H-hydrate dehydratase [Vibrio astriarenae]|uniref:Bifunctional NAD(P)H-hydrate repair enzyme n=1 Tax=Vibrio astriarenae TaxID=1481923 RepID=A0A7Z2T7S0_9VIBR|nr:NAD(P)H-hydrate dehydratase [Vibrio astriarenae]QIA65783.1 NAD(P)H-hydrate dehydratase [Vibrio astriarenae]